MKSRRRKRRRVRSLAALPSLLTLGNAVSGFAAIILLLKAYTYLQQGDTASASDQMYWATGLLALGMFCDMLDGRVARMTGTDSQFGAQLDSLCDAVTFCLAPAVFLRVFGEAVLGAGLGDEETSMGIRAIWAASAIYLACGLLRLARFNVETAEDDDHSEFSGLPTPAACGAVVSLFFISRFLGDHTEVDFGYSKIFSFALPLLGAGFGLLMISRVRYGHFLNTFFRGSKTIPQMVLVLGVLAGLFIFFGTRYELIFASIMLLYIFSGITLWLLNWLRLKGIFGGRFRVLHRDEDDDDDDDDESEVIAPRRSDTAEA